MRHENAIAAKDAAANAQATADAAVAALADAAAGDEDAKAALEAELDKMNAPWTPGRMPVWKE